MGTYLQIIPTLIVPQEKPEFIKTENNKNSNHKEIVMNSKF